MPSVLDHEHAGVERLIRGAAAVARRHEDAGCETCARLGVRRQLDGIAGRIRSARDPINNEPHPAPQPQEPPPPPPEEPPPTPSEGRAW